MGGLAIFLTGLWIALVSQAVFAVTDTWSLVFGIVIAVIGFFGTSWGADVRSRF
jgi:low affinity Fe/Cu permease